MQISTATPHEAHGWRPNWSSDAQLGQTSRARRTSLEAYCAWHVARDATGRHAVADNEHAYVAYCAVGTEWKANLAMLAPEIATTEMEVSQIPL